MAGCTTRRMASSTLIPQQCARATSSATAARPGISWPGGAHVVINLVLVYEAGSEYSVAWGDDRNDGWGEYADPGVQPPQRDPGTEAHYEFGSRAGVWRLARIFDAATVPVTVSAAAVALELNPAVPSGCASATTT